MQKIKSIIVIAIILTSCSNKEELTGKTKKGDLKSPCVSTKNGPCSVRINPNLIKLQPKYLKEKQIIS